MSLLAKGLLSFTTVAAIQDIPIPSETSKLIISGVFSLGSVLIVELFKYLKGRRTTRKTNQTNEQQSQTENDNSQSRQITPTADNL